MPHRDRVEQGPVFSELSVLYADWHQAMGSTASRLLIRAQSCGTAGAHLDASDLLALASGIAVASADTKQTERCLELLRHGTGP